MIKPFGEGTVNCGGNLPCGLLEWAQKLFIALTASRQTGSRKEQSIEQYLLYGATVPFH